MTSRSSRNKVRYQVFSALADMKRAENHLLQLAGMANDQSKYIDDNLPQIIAALTFIIETLDKFSEGL